MVVALVSIFGKTGNVLGARLHNRVGGKGLRSVSENIAYHLYAGWSAWYCSIWVFAQENSLNRLIQEKNTC